MTESEEVEIPRKLQLLVDRVTSGAANMQATKLRTERAVVVEALQALGCGNKQIAKLLGVSKQYVYREFPGKELKP
jgi:DNA-binding NarL/FixJ family response regulator